MAKKKDTTYRFAKALGLIAALAVALFVLYRFLSPLTFWRVEQPTFATAGSDSADDSELRAPQPLPLQPLEQPTRFALRQPLVQSKKILLGSTVPKTGELGLIGRSVSDGVFLYLNKTNSVDGGVGHLGSLSLDMRDDSGLVERAKPHIYDLLTKTSLFLAAMGDIVFEKIYVPLLRAGAAASLFPCVGMRQGVDLSWPIIWFRPSYAREVAALVHYAHTTLKVTKFAIFYEESSWGLEAKAAAEEIIGRMPGGLLACSTSYQANTVNVQAAVHEVKKASPQAVLCLAGGRAAYNFIREALNVELHAVSFLGLSRTASIADQLKKARGVQLITTSVVPNPHKSQLPIAVQYRAAMQRYLPNKGLSAESLEGYIAASLFVYFAAFVSKDATVESLIKSIENFSYPLIFKGLHLQLKDKTLSSSVWINTGFQNMWEEVRYAR